MALIRWREKIGAFFGADFDRVNSKGLTRLQTAIKAGDHDTVTSLLAVGANPNHKAKQNKPPLHLALDCNQKDIAITLIKSGATPDAEDSRKGGLLHKLMHTMRNDLSLVANEALKHNADPNKKDLYGRTPLHYMNNRNTSLGYLLCQNGANVNAQDLDGNTPLHNTIIHESAAYLLLERGADPNIPNDFGDTAYTLALKSFQTYGTSNMAGAMLAYGADPNAHNGYGATIAHIAARNKKPELLETAIKKGCDVLMGDKNGNTPLHLALICYDDDKCVKLLIKTAPEIIKLKNQNGETPYEMFVNNAERYLHHYNITQRNIIDTMLSHGCDVNTASAHKGKTLLHHAAENKDTLLVKTLLAHNPDIDQKDARGKTSLEYAIAEGNIDIVDILLDNGANPDTPDKNGWTLLDQLAKKNDRNSPIVQRLITAGGQYHKQLPLHPEQQGAHKHVHKTNLPANTNTPPKPDSKKTDIKKFKS